LDHIQPIIYDVGMNNGDDCEYYLTKGYRVVAVEANPALCQRAVLRFERELAEKRLSVLNLGVGAKPGRLPFYVHKTNSVLSTFVPTESRTGYTASLKAEEFDMIWVDIRRMSDVVAFFGDPHYIKIDVEGFDPICLRDLDLRGIYPNYLSAEAHTVDTFCHLVTMGYREFKMVSGHKVAADFAHHPIRLVNGALTPFQFKHHSAGPFGEDIPGEWMSSEAILDKWRMRGEGWFDLHARRDSCAAL
jgi:FkbM family methyltransferase